jgi:hypothetical protein
MNRTSDVDLVLHDYFADDGSSAPDRVLDVIEERIMRQPQQRAWRVSWRDSHVNGYLKPLLAVAAIVVVAVAGFAIFRPSSAGVGGPRATPTAFGGTVQFQDTGALFTTKIDAVASGATVTGTAVHTTRDGTHTVRLGCFSRDGDTWSVGGTVEQTTLPGEKTGFWSKVAVKDGSPQRIAVWLSADAPAGTDCAGFLALYGGSAALGAEDFFRVMSGELVPPPDPGP